ncbi:hypothetical protein PR202_gb27653 [Eleusine coracana subsp. coracana]|uniref:Uncharacterized protein n=1 Tax=Eleusine coracana subsp. coracana TaxID=191504 RepID=A0AAV5FVK3_ELECO|nr:hypothetical protein PR202_gb27653 [Eleusine coracana subsp. coracana]
MAGTSRISHLLLTLCTVSVVASASTSNTTADAFLSCLAAAIPSPPFHMPSSPSYTALFLSSVRNLRFVSPGTPRPLAIVAPTEPAAHPRVRCGRRHGVRLRNNVTSYAKARVWGEKYFKGTSRASLLYRLQRDGAPFDCMVITIEFTVEASVLLHLLTIVLVPDS